jgi:predicted ATPase
MRTLRNTWDRATDGFGQVLGIMGEPGVGKSRLLFQFISTLFSEDLNYLQGRCLPHGRSIAYLPFLDILKSFFMIKKGQSDSEIKKNIKEKVTTLNKEFSPTILSAFQQLLSLEIDNESWQNLEPVQRRKYIFDALNSLLIRLSEEKPLIIVVDDLQWIDRTSVDFLSNFKDLS